MVEVVISVMGLIIALAAYLAGVAVGKIAASKENGGDPDRVRVSPENIAGGAKHRPAKAS